jgi:NADH dehydrogenase FAD-containing subunit
MSREIDLVGGGHAHVEVIRRYGLKPIAGAKLTEYTPQDDFLSLLNLGDGTAVGSKWGFALEGRVMMWLKDKIDLSFMEKYQ